MLIPNFSILNNNFDYSEFCTYLKYTDNLQKLKIRDISYNSWILVFQSISSCKSIQVLYLDFNNLNKNYADLVNLIISNQKISTLSLLDCDLIIDIQFINAILINKSLLYLNLSKNKITNDCIDTFSLSNLKGINIRRTGLNSKQKQQIYGKIPHLDFSFDI